jgi:hypothetical protein
MEQAKGEDRRPTLMFLQSKLCIRLAMLSSPHSLLWYKSSRIDNDPRDNRCIVETTLLRQTVDGARGTGSSGT